MKIHMMHIRYFLVGIVSGALVVATSLYVQAQDVPPKLIISQQSSEDHTASHYPTIDDPLLQDKLTPNGTIKVEPYLTLPFNKAELEKRPHSENQLYDITEAWIYSDHELEIHGVNPLHGGVDVYVPYGTKVISPVSGYVVSSYQLATLYDESGELQQYKGKQVRMGLGYFVYIYVPSVKRWVEIGHLADIDASIPFLPPRYEAGNWIPPTSQIALSEFLTNPQVKFIEKGHPIGTVGQSGLIWGDYEEYQEGANRPIVIDPQKNISWDEPHIHLEEFWVHQITGEKGWQRDPYGIYSTFEKYPTQTRITPMGKDTLWLLDDYNFPRFTQE